MLSVVLLACCLLLAYTNAFAGVEWKILKQLKIKEKPLDVGVSLDGKNLYILAEGKLIIYSLAEAKGKYSIPVNKSFDKLRISTANGSIILLSTSEKLIEIVQLQNIQHFDASGSLFQGSDRASVTICTFFEYRCPHCAQLEPLLQQVLGQYMDKVKIVFKYLPSEGDALSFKVAAAAFAAREQNKFMEYHEGLFASTDKLDDLKLQALAAELGLDMKKFNIDMQSPSVQGIINRDIGEAVKAEVSGIPAVFINGKRLENHTLEGFQQMIDAELNKQAAALSNAGK